MGQFPARVLQEEFPVQRERRREDICEQETTVGEDVCRVRSPDHNLEGDEKLEFAHERKADSQHDRNRDKDRICNHENSCGRLSDEPTALGQVSIGATVATSNYSQTEWDAAKQEIKSLLIERAKLRGMIPYSELAEKVRSMNLEAHDQRLFHLLGEISSEESNAGRGMLSVIVVHKVGDMQPGPGFFDLAKRLGRDTSDILKC